MANISTDYVGFLLVWLKTCIISVTKYFTNVAADTSLQHCRELH